MKKTIFTILLLTAIIAFSFSYVLATDDNSGSMLQNATDGVRNFVGDAENGIEDAARDVSNASKDATSNMENKDQKDTSTNNRGDDRNTTTGNANDNDETAMTNDRDTSGNYTATRTSSATDNSILGMDSSTLIWIIMAIVAIAIIALVYSYSVGNTNRNNYHDDDNE